MIPDTTRAPLDKTPAEQAREAQLAEALARLLVAAIRNAPRSSNQHPGRQPSEAA